MEKVKALVKVESLEMLDPTFEGGEVRTARATLTNPTTSEFTYTTELYLGILKVATSGVGTVTIPANSSESMDYTITMPLTEGVYEVFLDVWVGGELLAHYKATEDITIVVVPAIDVGPITWV